ncbi:MAG: ATP-binding cassette domain-containing protein [Solirubrobacterales bacterium]
MTDDGLDTTNGSGVIDVLSVTKAFGELEVLKGIDLTVGEHEAVALIGASGSGKSTLLRCVDLLEVGPAATVIDSPSEPETRRFLGRLHQGGLA